MVIPVMILVAPPNLPADEKVLMASGDLPELQVLVMVMADGAMNLVANMAEPPGGDFGG